jgi:hypothetical protein
MSHAEIWDDSALIESWNEALEEYKVSYWLITRSLIRRLTKSQHYHSIHARGERVEDVLQSHDTEEITLSVGWSIFRRIYVLTHSTDQIFH